MFYLTSHSTHLYLLLYGIGHMVTAYRDNERKITTAASLSDRTIPDRTAHTTAFVISAVEHVKVSTVRLCMSSMSSMS